jgi:hypothetical protein
MSPTVAVAWTFPHPFIVLGGVVVDAILHSLHRHRFVGGKVNS